MERILTHCLNVTFIVAFIVMTYTSISAFKQTEAMTIHFAEATIAVQEMKSMCTPQKKQSYPKVRQLEVETALWTF
jgi:hypothetical protein